MQDEMLWIPFSEIHIPVWIDQWWNDNGPRTELGELVPIREALSTSDRITSYRDKAMSLMVFNNRYGYYFMVRAAAENGENHVVTLGRIKTDRRVKFRRNMSNVIKRIRKGKR